MLSLTRKTDYGLVAMADLARQHPMALSARDMSQRLRVPLPALQKILIQPMHRGLLVSTKGPHGGYRLARLPESITLAELVDAVEGSFKLTLCSGPASEQLTQNCSTREVCPISASVRKVHALLQQCLTQVTLQQLAFDTVPAELTLTADHQSEE